MADSAGARPPGRAIRTLIVDDEPPSRDRIRALLEADADIVVVGECADGEEAVERIREALPDLVFLDVEMPRRGGFEALRELEPEQMPFIVFVTAHDAYALRAFEVHALDYLLKPFDEARFRAALERAKTEVAHHRDAEFAARVAQMLAAREEGVSMGAEGGGSSASAEDATAAGNGDGSLGRLVVKQAGRVRFIDIGSVDWFEAADYYVRLHVGSDSFLIRTTMKRLEAALDPALFIRIHRSTIVRMDFIRELQPFFKGEYVVLLRDGTRRALSRSRRRALEHTLGQRL